MGEGGRDLDLCNASSSSAVEPSAGGACGLSELLLKKDIIVAFLGFLGGVDFICSSTLLLSAESVFLLINFR